MNLYPHQAAAISRAVSAPGRRFFMLDDTGTGKTIQAIEAARHIFDEIRSAQRITQWYPPILIVTPAIVRRNWKDELDTWWPDHPPVGLITAGRENESLTKKQVEERDQSYAASIKVVSYNLVSELPEDAHFDVIILDEAHRLKSPKTKWSKHIRGLVANNPHAAVFALTATPIPDRPQDAHNLLDTVCPGRFGTRHKFQDRYQLYEADEYAYSGKKFYGVNPVHAPELRDRIAAISSRTTKDEIAHLLPPFDVGILRVKVAPVGLTEWSKESVEAALYGNALGKLPSIIEWATDAAESSTHITIMTHHRDMAKKIGAAVQKALPEMAVHVITGALTPEKRNEALDYAKNSANAVVVATMDSIGIGIDMTFTPQALFAELHYRPEVMIQALGRFSRLSGTCPSTCRLLVAEGTIDEVIASKLEEKVKAINAAIKAGQTESALETSLGSVRDDKDWLEELRQAASSVAEEDDYLCG